MDVKRIFRGPWVWIAVAVVGVLLAFQFLAPNGRYDEVDTSTMSKYISSGEVKTVTFVDRDQTIQAELALDEKGKFLGMRGSIICNTGAHSVMFVPLVKCSELLTSVYRVPAASPASQVTATTNNSIPPRSRFTVQG